MRDQVSPARDAGTPPLTNRLHRLVGRLSEVNGFIVAQADVAEAVARIVQLERALGAMLDHIGHVEYLDAGGCQLGDGIPVISGARTGLGIEPFDAARCPTPPLDPHGADAGDHLVSERAGPLVINRTA